MISGRGSNLAAIIAAGLPVSSVVSSSARADGLRIARMHGISCAAIERSAFADAAGWEDAMAGFIEAVGSELVALAGFMRILSESFISRCGGRIVNIHPSLLPDLPGRNTHARALAEGRTEHGCSVHWVAPAVDAGPVISQARVAVLPADTPASLARRVRKQEHRLYPQALADILAGRARRPA